MAGTLKPMDVVEARRAVHYDGINSAEIAALIDDFTVVSETPSELTFTSGGQNGTVARGGYISYAGGVADRTFANADDFGDAYTAVSAHDHVHELVLVTGGAKPMPEAS